MTEEEVSQLLKNNLNEDFVYDFFITNKLDEDILEKYIGYFNLLYQFEKIVLEEEPENWWIEFVEKEINIQYLWNYISCFQKLSENFISRNFNQLNCREIFINQKLSESFIERNNDKMDWNLISKYQKLSESFIERYLDKVNWIWISSRQKLSEGFIEKHADKVDWFWISKCQKLSEEFKKKYYFNI